MTGFENTGDVSPADGAESLGPEPGTVIAETYTVVRLLGQGGMGVVVLAYDHVLDRHVAIKFIRKDLIDEGDLRERFLVEARAMARVRHPNVLPIYAFGEYDSVPYFVTELVEGPNVETWLRGRPSGTYPDIDVALKIIDETCRGVSAIHAAQTVHRDLKPGNLLLGDEFRVRVADMGVADLLLRARNSDRPELVGTPEYMAPENVVQTQVPPELVPRADVYALGCLAFELLTGTTPFRKKGSVAGMLARLLEDVPLPSVVRPDLGDAFDSVILRALARDPANRTESAEILREELLNARKRSADPVRILVADDDDDFRELLIGTLSREFPSAAIESARDGRTALEAFDRATPSIAIVDLQMPDVTGLELTERLRARDSARNVPIIVITASGGASEWQRLSALGADGFLVKPVNAKDVVTLVRRALDERSVNEVSSSRAPGSTVPSSEAAAAREADTLVAASARLS